jgi:hypothetical protein
VVTKICSCEDELLEIEVRVEGGSQKAYAFPRQTGKVRIGDQVLLNTTAVDLKLGSGGYHFVMANLTEERSSGGVQTGRKAGHIMKLRYTPFQLKVMAAEEPGSPWRGLLEKTQDLGGIPVIGGSLHSMLVPCVCGIKAVNKDLRVAYVMTDGGALPLGISKAVQDLKRAGFICGVVTTGHAFGGDCEAVNLYSGLLAARAILNAQVIVALMGPGVVGTGTTWGHTGIEAGLIINAVSSLNGTSYTIPRLSFADKRGRHKGVSHHTLTVLSRVALASTRLVLPALDEGQKKTVLSQLQGREINNHQLVWGRGDEGINLARRMGFLLNHMGRKFGDDPAFFLAASAAGEAAAGDFNKAGTQ